MTKNTNASELETLSDKDIVEEMAKLIANSMMPLIQQCVEQRLKQFLPLIKEGLLK